MLNNQPTDKKGYIILVGDLVSFPLPKSKKTGSGKVVEILDGQQIRIETDPLYRKVLDKLIICNARSVTDICWNRMRDDMGNPVKSNLLDNQKLENNYRFKSKEVKEEIKKLRAEFEMQLCEYQQIVHQKVRRLQDIARKLNSHSNILEPGDYVIWNDSMEKFYNPFLCQIEDPNLVKYRILNESLVPGNKVYWRYERDSCILFLFHEKEFKQLVKKNDIRFYDDFMKYAKRNCTPFNDDGYCLGMIEYIK